MVVLNPLLIENSTHKHVIFYADPRTACVNGSHASRRFGGGVLGSVYLLVHVFSEIGVTDGDPDVLFFCKKV